MAMTGATVGKVGRFRRTERAFLNQRVARISARNGRPFYDFVYAVLSLPGFDKLIEGISAGSAQANISATGIGNTPIPCLSEEDQIEIGKTARVLDDKIALLRETNVTLEAIAQALFKSWFVDFDPVRAKAEGRDPQGVPPEVADLFPSEFGDSELGVIPKGWRMATVGAVCAQIFSGGTPSTQNTEYWNGELPWFSSGETRNKIVIGTEKTITQAAVANSSTRLAMPGDILIASAGQGHTRGQTSYCAIETYINQSVVSVRANPSVCHPGWLFYNLLRRYEEMRGLSDSHSIRGSLTTKLLAGMRLLLPDARVMNAFSKLVTALLEAQVENHRRMETLSSLRDTLLPQLMSGKLHIPEIQKATEEATV